MNSAGTILTIAPRDQICHWLAKQDIGYDIYSYSGTATRWVIKEERYQTLFVLRWGIK